MPKLSVKYSDDILDFLAHKAMAAPIQFSGL
jgi:hypothetical protein